ncbi:MAG TPA: sugar dehydrogenase [Isosphaeraceae bacterium]|nr:sugar dehydrogenase [Isosphaeraceae bacterium]
MVLLLLGLPYLAAGSDAPVVSGGGVASAASGYEARKLALPADVLPSCMAVRPDGTLVVGSMDGDILLVVDSNHDGVLDRYKRWAGTLPHWPLGLLADGDQLLVATRHGLLRLSDRDGDGWAERWETLSDAWDISRDHHDWTTGIARWPSGGWVVSPVTDDVRAKDVQGRHHMRGKAVLVEEDGKTKVLAEGLRYPTGWANRPTDGAVFFTDNQGQQKTTCEINPLVVGGWYGYASQADARRGKDTAVVPPVVRIPYPWARSVNGLAFADCGGRFGPLEGQLVLCEYNNRLLLRASLEEVNGQTQGACYPFLERLLGPLCLAFAPDGSLYVGSLREPAWGGEPEQGAVYQVRYSGKPVFGIQEIRALASGFTITFFTQVPDRKAAEDRKHYQVRRYHHVYQGEYHSPPTDEQTLHVESARVSSDGKTVHLKLREAPLADRIYELRTTLPAQPAVGHYTMNRCPTQE